MFRSLPKVNNNTIEAIVEYHEDHDHCRDLSKKLALYSSVQPDADGFKNSMKLELQKRKKVIDRFKDRNFIPNYKYIDNSKMLQLAFLDKIIEECDQDRKNN